MALIMFSNAPDKVKILYKYAFSLILTTLVIEALIIYFDWPELTVNLFSLLVHAFVFVCLICGTLLLLRSNYGLVIFKLLAPLIFYRFYQYSERKKLLEILESDEVISYFREK